MDESFVDFSENYQDNTLLSNVVLEAYPHMMVMKSISKSYGVPGLRLGILASANVELIERLKQNVAIWNINSFAEFFMQIFTKYESDYQVACSKFQTVRSDFYQQLQQVPYLRVIESQANFFLCEVIDKYTSQQLVKIVLDKYNILLKDCSTKKGFNGKNYIRIAVRNKVDNGRLAEVLMSL